MREPRAIGAMQGRLSPPVGGRIQAFPKDSWAAEFARATALGLRSIEWILETPLESNPLWSAEGCAEVERATRETGVRVDFVCADYFMESPFVRMSPVDLDRNRSVLDRLIEQAARLGIIGIEIPCVDASEIRNREEEDELARALAPGLDHAARAGIQLGLETSLNPERFRGLLERIGHPALKANYDTGNSASLGYDVDEEMDAYGKWINNVHIKDRVRGGSTVPLGTGNADIPRALRLLKRCGYQGGFILQAARQSGPETETVRRYKAQVEGWMGEAGY